MIRQFILHLAKVSRKKQIESDSFLRVFTGSEFRFVSRVATMYSVLMEKNTFVIKNPDIVSNRLNRARSLVSLGERHWRLDRTNDDGSLIRAIIFISRAMVRDDVEWEVVIYCPCGHHGPTLKAIQFAGGFLY